MGIKQYKPTSPGRRGATGQTFEEITKRKPETPEGDTAPEQEAS